MTPKGRMIGKVNARGRLDKHDRYTPPLHQRGRTFTEVLDRCIDPPSGKGHLVERVSGRAERSMVAKRRMFVVYESFRLFVVGYS